MQGSSNNKRRKRRRNKCKPKPKNKKFNKTYPKNGRTKYGARSTRPQLTTTARAKCNLNNKLVDGHNKFGRFLEDLGFKIVGGAIRRKYRCRIIMFDETGNDKARSRRKTTHMNNQSNRKINRKHLPHITLAIGVTLSGDHLPILLITKHSKYINPKILEELHYVDDSCLLASSDTGYINAAILLRI